MKPAPPYSPRLRVAKGAGLAMAMALLLVLYAGLPGWAWLLIMPSLFGLASWVSG